LADSHGGAKGTTAHTEADAHGRAFPPFQKETFASQLLSLLIAFVALYLIVSRIALPRVGSLLDARQNAIDSDLAEAQKLKDASGDALKAERGFGSRPQAARRTVVAEAGGSRKKHCIDARERDEERARYRCGSRHRDRAAAHRCSA
jgi:F-type H+-transporting ATPase subunit b